MDQILIFSSFQFILDKPRECYKNNIAIVCLGTRVSDAWWTRSILQLCTWIFLYKYNVHVNIYHASNVYVKNNFKTWGSIHFVFRKWKNSMMRNNIFFTWSSAHNYLNSKLILVTLNTRKNPAKHISTSICLWMYNCFKNIS